MDDDRYIQAWVRVGEQARGQPATLAHVCAALLTAVDVDGGGVTVRVSAALGEVVHATDGIAAELEELQLTLGEGPCVDGYNDGAPTHAADLESSEYFARWPAFTVAALRRGARAVFALPLQVGAIRLGVMDLYRTRPGPLRPAELAETLTFAQVATVRLLDAAATAPDTDEPPWPHDQIIDQAVVHQATGMILVQLGVTAETALTRLRAHAYANDRSVAEVAHDVIDRRLRFAPDRRIDGSPERGQ